MKTFLLSMRDLMFLSAFIHMSVLTIFAVINLDITYLNLFDILELDLIFPEIAKGMISQIASAISMVVIFGVIYIWRRKSTN